MAEAGFDDVRRAHNAVFVNVPSEGIRLTELLGPARFDELKGALFELVRGVVGGRREAARSHRD